MLLVAMQVDTVVGVVFMIAGHEVFAAYRGPGALADLHTGGIVMWMGSDIVMSVIAVAVAVALVRPAPRPASRAPASRAAGPSAAGDAALAAYNSYLASLDQGARRAAGLDG
jgi:putative membrane protein